MRADSKDMQRDLTRAASHARLSVKLSLTNGAATSSPFSRSLEVVEAPGKES